MEAAMNLPQGRALRAAFACVFVTLLAATGAALARAASPAAFPPVVVATVPAPGDVAVDPSLAEIRVTFSKDMQTEEMWSFVYANPAAFPKVTGPIRYEGKRTCVMPVSLEPGKTYGTWINSNAHTSFRDTSGLPAVPYLLVFETVKRTR